MGVLRVAAVQLRVSRDRASNLRRAAELIDAAAADGAQFVALPECFTGKYGVELFHGHREELVADAAASASCEEGGGSGVLEDCNVAAVIRVRASALERHVAAKDSAESSTRGGRNPTPH